MHLRVDVIPNILINNYSLFIWLIWDMYISSSISSFTIKHYVWINTTTLMPYLLRPTVFFYPPFIFITIIFWCIFNFLFVQLRLILREIFRLSLIIKCLTFINIDITNFENLFNEVLNSYWLGWFSCSLHLWFSKIYACSIFFLSIIKYRYLNRFCHW